LSYGYKVFGSSPRQMFKERVAGVGVPTARRVGVGVAATNGVTVTCGAQAGRIQARKRKGIRTLMKFVFMQPPSKL
jgi:hypothetical protein